MLNLSRHRVICLIVLLGSLTGCAHYQLGTGAASLDFVSIYLAPVENTAAVPQAVAPVSRALRLAIADDPRVQLAPRAEAADAIIEIDLVKYGRDFTAVLPTDTALARKFDLTLTARITLRNQRTGTTVFENREVTSTRQIFVDSGQGPAEYQVMPQLADDLARQIAHVVLDVW